MNINEELLAALKGCETILAGIEKWCIGQPDSFFELDEYTGQTFAFMSELSTARTAIARAEAASEGVGPIELNAIATKLAATMNSETEVYYTTETIDILRQHLASARGADIRHLKTAIAEARKEWDWQAQLPDGEPANIPSDISRKAYLEQRIRTTLYNVFLLAERYLASAKGGGEVIASIDIPAGKYGPGDEMNELINFQHVPEGHVVVPVSTLKVWREYIDLNPADLAPRIEAMIQAAPTTEEATSPMVLTDCVQNIHSKEDIKK